MKNMLQEKFKGGLFGLAIGDALGYPVEFANIKQIKYHFGEKGIIDLETHRNKTGLYSDDTQMSLATAAALIDSPNYDINTVMKNIRKRYIEWKNSPENNRSPGHTCMSGIRNMETGIDWRQSGIRTSKGCGAAMRTAPIGLYFYDNIPKLCEIAEAASRCTHAHPTGIASGIATAYLTALAMNNTPPENMIQLLCALPACNEPEFITAIKKLPAALQNPDKESAIESLGQGWIGEEAIAIALYSFLKSPDNYEATVLTAVNHSGDSDSTGCIAGAISGAYNGFNVIPKEWIDKIENKKGLEEIAKKLGALK